MRALVLARSPLGGHVSEGEEELFFSRSVLRRARAMCECFCDVFVFVLWVCHGRQKLVESGIERNRVEGGAVSIIK